MSALSLDVCRAAEVQIEVKYENMGETKLDTQALLYRARRVCNEVRKMKKYR